MRVALRVLATVPTCTTVPRFAARQRLRRTTIPVIAMRECVLRQGVLYCHCAPPRPPSHRAIPLLAALTSNYFFAPTPLLALVLCFPSLLPPTRTAITVGLITPDRISSTYHFSLALLALGTPHAASPLPAERTRDLHLVTSPLITITCLNNDDASLAFARFPCADASRAAGVRRGAP